MHNSIVIDNLLVCTKTFQTSVHTLQFQSLEKDKSIPYALSGVISCYMMVFQSVTCEIVRVFVCVLL